MDPELSRWLAAQGYGAPQRQQPVGGGSINAAVRLLFRDGRRLFLKHNHAAPAGLFAAEAEGLRALREAGALRVPAVLLGGRRFLLLEDLGESPPHAGFWRALGRGLARLHADAHPRFGFTADNFCGATPQCNEPMADGHGFFARHRLLALGRSAHARDLLTSAELAALEHIAGHLSDWIPAQPAVLIHGDLWSGNIHCAGDGQPALLDPACYWGWAEADLAMTALFGGFDPQFYAGYAEAGALAPDWRERAPLYNLYHLLNHLLLFGGGYRAQVRQTLERFAPRDSFRG